MSTESDAKHTGREIRDEVLIEAPPEAVYRAWSDPELVPGWFVSKVEGRMEAGETVYWSFGVDSGGMTHRILKAEPPRQIVMELDTAEGPTRLEITIEQKGGHSLLRLVQSGFGEGPEWDDQYEGMLSGWMLALAVLKHFAERYFERKRTQILVLEDAQYDRDRVLELQRTSEGLSRWLSRSGSAGGNVGDPVRLELANGRWLTGTVLRATKQETLWSWDEIDGVLEIKAFRGAAWGSMVGVRIVSWMDDVSELADLKDLLGAAVGKLATLVGRW
jgi:uncharacterized protein YndB with AHSA1/START domain